MIPKSGYRFPACAKPGARFVVRLDAIRSPPWSGGGADERLGAPRPRRLLLLRQRPEERCAARRAPAHGAGGGVSRPCAAPRAGGAPKKALTAAAHNRRGLRSPLSASAITSRATIDDRRSLRSLSPSRHKAWS